MIVSNALPIQFWDVDDETYNEKEVCGITERCWCYPAEWDDEILIQFQDDPGQTLLLFLMTSDGNNAERETFSEVASGIYQATITIPHLTRNAQLLIRENGSVVTGNIITNSSFSGGLAPWTNQVDGGSDWDNVEAGTARVLSMLTGQFSNRLLQTFADTSASNLLETSISGLVTGPFGVESSGYIRFYFYKDGVELTDLRADFPWATDGVGSGIFSTINPRFFIEDQSIDAVAFSAHCIFCSSSVSGPTIRMDDYGIAVLDGYDVLKKSDCISMAESQDCAELIEFSNYKNAFGLDYESTSPAPIFKIRVPMVFFHDSFPMEQQVHKLSNDTRVRLWNEMAHKRNLQLGFMPYYMHQKINLILMHDNILADGLYWSKDDPYEIIEGNNRFPLKKANVLLTERDFNKRNLI